MKTTTVVLFVIMLFLLFEKTESRESGESGESSDSTDSTDSMFQNSCVSRLFVTVRCNFVRLIQYQTKEKF